MELCSGGRLQYALTGKLWRSILDDGSGNGNLESAETQDGRNMVEEGMMIDDDSVPIQTVPPLFNNLHLDDDLQLEAATPLTELEPQPPEIDLASFFLPPIRCLNRVKQ